MTGSASDRRLFAGTARTARLTATDSLTHPPAWRAVARNTQLRLAIWTSIPTHHQSGFHQALRDAGVDLRVHYLQRVTPDRLRLGWDEPTRLPAGERYVEPDEDLRATLGGLRDRIHIVPGANSRTMLRLCTLLSFAGIPWLHWSEPGRPRARFGFKRLLRRAYAVVVNEFALGALANGELARQDFIEWGVDPARIRFLPYSIPGLVAADAGASAEARGVRFMQVGVLCERKGTDLLLQAFAAVLRRAPQCTLTLVGYDATAGEYDRAAQRLGIADNVEFAGAVPAAKVAAMMARADVVVLASRFDGWGVALNEAASLGRALVSTRATGAAHHLIEPGHNGFVVPAADPAALAAALLRYAVEPALAAEHGARSRMIFQDFTPPANARRLQTAIDSLLALHGL